MPRYTAYGADRAGEFTLLETDDLPKAADLLASLRARPYRSQIYFISDSERDGAPVDEETLEEMAGKAEGENA